MPAVILAAGMDWLEGLVGALFVVIWIVSQIVNVIRAARGVGKPAGKPGPKVVVRPRPPQPAPAAADPREALARQIEEFLRRSPPEGPRRPDQPQRAKPRAGQPTTGDRRQAPPRRPPPPPVPPAAPAASAGPAGGEVAAHVRDAFAHEIAHLHSPLEGAAPALATRPVTPHPIVALLRDPAALRQLVIVREVLDRPVERW